MIVRSSLIAALFAGLLAVAGCGDDEPPPSADGSPTSSSIPQPTTSSPKPQSPEEKVEAAALETYRAAWAANERAAAKPKARDWKPELRKYLGEPALSNVLIDINDYAKWPAHREGRHRLTPKVVEVKSKSKRPHTVIIEDCVDATDVHVISDKAGEKGKSLDDPAQPDRYLFEARLAWYPKPKLWRVYQMEARLEEPC